MTRTHESADVRSDLQTFGKGPWGSFPVVSAWLSPGSRAMRRGGGRLHASHGLTDSPAPLIGVCRCLMASGGRASAPELPSPEGCSDVVRGTREDVVERYPFVLSRANLANKGLVFAAAIVVMAYSRASAAVSTFTVPRSMFLVALR